MGHIASRLLIAPVVAALAAAAIPAVAAEEPAEGKPVPARTVLVVAKIQEEVQRRALEKATAAELQKRGVEPTLGSDVLTAADFESLDTIRKKVESLGVDGVLGFAVLGIDESVKSSSMSIGFGVGGYGGGGMGMMVGGSMPIGGSTTVVRKVRLRARYFARPFQDPAWEKVYNEKLQDDTSWLRDYVANASVTALKKKKLIPAK